MSIRIELSQSWNTGTGSDKHNNARRLKKKKGKEKRRKRNHYSRTDALIGLSTVVAIEAGSQ